MQITICIIGFCYIFMANLEHLFMIRMMDTVQKHNHFINKPWSQTFRSYSYSVACKSQAHVQAQVNYGKNIKVGT
jgi:hypothetical protein